MRYIFFLQMLAVGILLLFTTPLYSDEADLNPDNFCPPDAEEDFYFDDFEEEYADLDLEEEITEFNLETGEVGITSGIRVTNTLVLGPATFQIDDPEAVTTVRFAIIYNSLLTRPRQPLPAMFGVLVNEVPLEINPEGDLFIEVLLVPGQYQEIVFDVPKFAPGLYDLVLFGIPASNLPPLPAMDEMGRVGESIIRRVTLIVGNPANLVPFEQSFTLLTPLAEWEDVEQTNRLTPRSVIPSLTESNRWWAAPDSAYVTTAPSEIFSFNLTTRYEYYNLADSQFAENERFPFAYLMFLNYEPVPFDDSNAVYYGEVSRETAAAITPVTLTTPQSAGMYDLVIIQIAHPRVPQCFVRQFLFDTVEVIPLQIMISEQ